MTGIEMEMGMGMEMEVGEMEKRWWRCRWRETEIRQNGVEYGDGDRNRVANN
jgi:hypothetical protein